MGGLERVGHLHADGGGAGLGERAGAADERRERLAVEELHHEEARAVLGDVIIEDAHRAAVLDGIGDVAFAQRLRADDEVETRRLELVRMGHQFWRTCRLRWWPGRYRR